MYISINLFIFSGLINIIIKLQIKTQKITGKNMISRIC